MANIEQCPGCGASYYSPDEQCQNCGHGEPPEDLCDFVPDAEMRGECPNCKGAVEALREIATYHDHGRFSAISPAWLAGKAQQALDNLHPGGR